MTNTILQGLCQSLKISADSIDHRKPFSDYGLDSILGVSFVKHLNDRPRDHPQYRDRLRPHQRRSAGPPRGQDSRRPHQGLRCDGSDRAHAPAASTSPLHGTGGSDTRTATSAFTRHQERPAPRRQQISDGTQRTIAQVSRSSACPASFPTPQTSTASGRT